MNAFPFLLAALALLATATPAQPSSALADTLNKLSNEGCLIENLKELVIIDGKKNINPLEHELLNKLIEHNKLKNLSEIKSISNYYMRNKYDKHDYFEFQIWKFDNKDNAKLYFDLMKWAININSYYEKPPKRFFLVSDELYYFRFIYNRLEYMISIENKLINRCFSEDEAFFSH